MRTLPIQREISGSGTAQVQAPTDVAALIDEQPMSRVQVLVAVLCALAVFFDGYDIQVMALAVPALSQEWGMAPSRFGMALAAV
ncbi:MAG TPA: hypothetical protein VLJ19_01160, partial [Variovorax sp.]|nr:hypothetical protein [Variovorax sp.]